jgi:hypothetical protein
MASRSGTSEKNFKLLFTGESGIPGGEARRRAMGFDLIAWCCSLD